MSVEDQISDDSTLSMDKRIHTHEKNQSIKSEKVEAKVLVLQHDNNFSLTQSNENLIIGFEVELRL